MTEEKEEAAGLVPEDSPQSNKNSPSGRCISCGQKLPAYSPEKLPKEILSKLVSAWLLNFGNREPGSKAGGLSVTASTVSSNSKFRALFCLYFPILLDFATKPRAVSIEMGRILSALCSLPELSGVYKLEKEQRAGAVRYFLLKTKTETV